jgi:hypothetical protein
MNPSSLSQPTSYSWPLPAQSFSGPSPLVLVTIFYCLIWDFTFRRLLRLAGSRWRYSTPPPHGWHGMSPQLSIYNHLARTEYKTPLPTVTLLLFSYSLQRERVYRSVVYSRIVQQPTYTLQYTGIRMTRLFPAISHKITGSDEHVLDLRIREVLTFPYTRKTVTMTLTTATTQSSIWPSKFGP